MRRRRRRLEGRLLLEERRQHSADPLCPDGAITDEGEEILDRVRVEELAKFLLPIGQGQAQPAQLTLDQFLALLQILLAGVALEPLTDLLAGVRRLDEAEVLVEPVAGGSTRLLTCDDLDDVAVVQRLVERDEPA